MYKSTIFFSVMSKPISFSFVGREDYALLTIDFPKIKLTDGDQQSFGELEKYCIQHKKNEWNVTGYKICTKGQPSTDLTAGNQALLINTDCRLIVFITVLTRQNASRVLKSEFNYTVLNIMDRLLDLP